MKSFLQTKEWMEFHKSLGRQVFNYDNGKIKANIVKHDLPFGKNYLYKFIDFRSFLFGNRNCPIYKSADNRRSALLVGRKKL